ncbi:hypothetical protein SRB17_03570 [Streptomyces sp. RB17]|uniref:hypothetical protein n=1 Tax=Streptomyces sp. RB17 TaxID=2585197 RepID=UPI001294D13C|nr:hypothetical protein [Streptomyces sp. RB17]MQY32409.1 hypothetical protein [Streptomyces sp. RB17]
MRKLHRVALVVAAAGGLSAVGAGPSSAAVPAYGGGAPLPVSQPDAQADSATSSQASVQSYGSPAPYAAPQHGAEVTPQVNPNLSPQVNPQLSPQAAPQPAPGGLVGQTNLFRPSQECSPQSLLNAAVPVALLAASETHGIECTQANTQSNALAHASTH